MNTMNVFNSRNRGTIIVFYRLRLRINTLMTMMGNTTSTKAESTHWALSCSP